MKVARLEHCHEVFSWCAAFAIWGKLMTRNRPHNNQLKRSAVKVQFLHFPFHSLPWNAPSCLLCSKCKLAANIWVITAVDAIWFMCESPCIQSPVRFLQGNYCGVQNCGNSTLTTTATSNSMLETVINWLSITGSQGWFILEETQVAGEASCSQFGSLEPDWTVKSVT